MAVYTQLDDEDFRYLAGEFGLGELKLYKGIAEGVSNSNFIVETLRPGSTTNDRHIVTIYEARTEVAELPFFLGLMDHLAAKGCPVPATIHDTSGRAFRDYHGKALAFIEFLSGFTVSHPRPGQARAVGVALAQMHVAAQDFAGTRANTMGPAEWARLLGACGSAGLASIDPELEHLVARELPAITASWPADLPRGIIHADLFPDNVLMDGDTVTGLIDFYFACTDLLAFDLAVTHAAWCFDAKGENFDAAVSASLIAGYESVRPLLPAERAALPLLARGAAMRFLATRAYDWINTPADALVTKKDPMAFARRLQFYCVNPTIFA